MLRPGACERVDGLVVVADDAEIVAVAEPQIEQRLLQQVDVLILVDGERSVLRAEGRGCAIVVLEQPHGALEQVFEIEDAVGFLAPFVVGVHPCHQIDRDRRLAVLRDGEVLLGADAAILRPLDLRREVARRTELVRRAQAVADLAQEQRLRRQNPPELARSEVAELPQRRGVEGPGPHARDPERREPHPELAPGLVGEGDGHDLGRFECAGRDLTGYAPGDRRRLARPCAGEDADGAAHGLGCAPLLGIQAVERVHGVTVALTPDGIVTPFSIRFFGSTMASRRAAGVPGARSRTLDEASGVRGGRARRIRRYSER